MVQYIDKSAVVAEIERRIKECDKLADAAADNNLSNTQQSNELLIRQYTSLLDFIDTLEVKKVNVSLISENLAVAHEYLDYTSTGNLAHNKPMVNARLKWAIKGLFDAGLFELTHDKKYRMKSLGLKAQKGE